MASQNQKMKRYINILVLLLFVLVTGNANQTANAAYGRHTAKRGHVHPGISNGYKESSIAQVSSEYSIAERDQYSDDDVWIDDDDFSYEKKGQSLFCLAFGNYRLPEKHPLSICMDSDNKKLSAPLHVHKVPIYIEYSCLLIP